MNFDNICFHNVEELIFDEERKGYIPQRVPEYVREKLNERARDMVISPAANVELRFLLESESTDITLSTAGEAGLRMFVFNGDFQDRQVYEIGPEAKTITITANERYKQLSPECIKDSSYNYKLVRLMFTGTPDAQLMYYGVEKGQISLPVKKDVPLKRLLAYGTSITHGAMLSTPYLTYPFLTSKALGMDLINLGQSGAAFCEKEMADYIASRNDWDIAVLAMSVNMYNNEAFTCTSFKERVEYMVNTVSGAHPDKPVFCVTIYPFFDDIGIYNDDSTRNVDDYRQALRDVVKDCEFDNVRLIEGSEVLKDFTLLSSDLLHPTDLGMIQMANNLSTIIANSIN